MRNKKRGYFRKSALDKTVVFLNAINNSAVDGIISTNNNKISEIASKYKASNALFYHAVDLGYFTIIKTSGYKSNVKLFNLTHAQECSILRNELAYKKNHPNKYSDTENTSDIPGEIILEFPNESKNIPNEIILEFPNEGLKKETFDMLSKKESKKREQALSFNDFSKKIPSKPVDQQKQKAPSFVKKNKKSLTIFWGLIKFNW